MRKFVAFVAMLGFFAGSIRPLPITKPLPKPIGPVPILPAPIKK